MCDPLSYLSLGQEEQKQYEIIFSILLISFFLETLLEYIRKVYEN